MSENWRLRLVDAMEGGPAARKCVTKNIHRPVSWIDRIARAKKSGRFTKEDVLLSRHWVTCACGQQEDAIPRREANGAPFDGELDELGMTFMYHVVDNNIEPAARTLASIQKRAIQVLKEAAAK